MADIQSNININVDTTNAMAAIRNLQSQISAFHQQMQKSGSAANAAASANMQRNLINNVNATKKFSASLTNVSTETESFTNALEKNKLSMGQYFRYAGASSRTFGRVFRNEFNTISKVAESRVRTLQTQYVKMGRDASGAMKAIKIRPLSLDMQNLSTQTMMAAQKQQIFNQLLKQGSTNLLNFGKNTQWAGRQLMVGFTVPLSIMGATAIKEFQKIEEQVIRLKRVYGDMFTTDAETEKAVESVRKLADEFTKYGIAVESTIGLAASVAQMGNVGADMINQVTEATKLAVLGGMEQEKALDTTISLTNAFGIATEDLTNKINFLNAAENQTILAIDDFTEAVPKAGSVVAQLGGSVEDLAFFLTAMREGGVNASQAANALKSSLARLVNPTKQAREDLGKLGIDILDIVESNVGDLRGTIMDLGVALDDLEPLQRSRALEELFGKFQFARMSTLFQNISKEGSQAQEILKLTRNSAEELQVLADRELSRVEESPATKLQKSIEKLQASLAPIGAEFAKLVTPLVEFITDVLKKFNEMGDGAKSFVTGLVTVLGLIAPAAIMSFGLIANGIANVMKAFNAYRSFLQILSGSNRDITTSTQYMTQEQLESASVATNLGQAHQYLAQQFTVEASALAQLTEVYRAATVEQLKYNAATTGTPARPVGPMRVAPPITRATTGRRAGSPGGPIGLNKGTLNVPGPRGAGDIVPAVLSPGEAVIPAKQSQKYSGFLEAIMNDQVPGMMFGGIMGNFMSRFKKPGFSEMSKMRQDPRVIQKWMRGRRNNVGVRMSSDNLFEMLASGDSRYTNLFDTGMSAVGDTPDKRALVEQQLFGINPSAPGSQRPVYGYMFNQERRVGLKNSKNLFSNFLTRFGFGRRRAARQSFDYGTGNLLNQETFRYGNLTLVPNRKAIKNRTTLTYGDSYNARNEQFATPLPWTQAGKATQQQVKGAYTSKDKFFVEAQIMGGFDLNEVDRIITTQPRLKPVIEDRLRKAGYNIPVGLPRYSFMDQLKRIFYPNRASENQLPTMNRQGIYKDRSYKPGYGRKSGTGSDIIEEKGLEGGLFQRLFGAIKGYENGVFSVPGPKGAGDIVPAMLAPGEAVVPAKQTQKYAGLIKGIISDNIPGFVNSNKKEVPALNNSVIPTGTSQSYTKEANEWLAAAKSVGVQVFDALTQKIIEAGGKVTDSIKNDPQFSLLPSLTSAKGGRNTGSQGLVRSHGSEPIPVTKEQAMQMASPKQQEQIANASSVSARNNMVFLEPAAANKGKLSGSERASFIRKNPETFMSSISEQSGIDAADPDFQRFALNVANRLEQAGDEAVTDSQFAEIVEQAMEEEIYAAGKGTKENVKQAFTDAKKVSTLQITEPGKRPSRKNITNANKGQIIDGIETIPKGMKGYRAIKNPQDANQIADEFTKDLIEQRREMVEERDVSESPKKKGRRKSRPQTTVASQEGKAAGQAFSNGFTNTVEQAPSPFKTISDPEDKSQAAAEGAETGREYSRKFDMGASTARSSTQSGQVSEEVVVGPDGNPIVDKKGRPVSQEYANRQARKMASRQKRGMVAGRLGGAMGSASMMLGMTSMMPGVGDNPIMQAVQGFMPALFGLSAVLPMLAALPGPLGILVGVVGAVAAGLVMWNMELKKTREEYRELGESLSSGTDSMQAFANAAGTVRPSEIMDLRRQGIGEQVRYAVGKTPFANQFFASEDGKALIENFEEGSTKIGRNVATSSITNQLATAVSSGILSREQAGQIALELGNQIDDFGVSVQIAGELNELFGPNGEKLLDGEPLELFMNTTERSMSVLETNVEEAISAITDDSSFISRAFGRDSAAIAGFASGALTGFIQEQENALDAFEVQSEKRITALEKEAEQLEKNGKDASSIYQQIADERNIQESERLRALDQYQQNFGNIASAISEDADLSNQKLADLRKQAESEIDTSISAEAGSAAGADPNALSREERIEQRFNSLVNSAQTAALKPILSSFGEGLKAQIEESMPEGMQKLAERALDEVMGQDELTIESKLLMSTAIAGGDLDATTIGKMIDEDGEGYFEIIGSIMLEGGPQATAQLDGILQSIANFTGDDYQDTMSELFLQINGLEGLDLSNTLDQLEMFSTFSSLLGEQSMLDFISLSASEKKEIQNSIDLMDELVNSTPDKPLTVEQVIEQKILTDESMIAAFKADTEFFEDLDPVQQFLYIQRFVAIQSTVTDDQAVASLINRGVRAASRGSGADRFAFSRKQIDDEISRITSESVKATLSVDNLLSSLGDNPPGGDGGGPVASSLDQILNKLRNVRDETVQLKDTWVDSFAEMNRVVGEGIDKFEGLSQQLRKLGATQPLIQYILGMSPEEYEERKDELLDFSGAKVVGLKEGAENLQVALNAIKLGEFQDAQQSSIQAIGAQTKAVTRLVAAGYSLEEAYGLVSDETLAYAIAAEENVDVMNKLVEVTKEASAANESFAFSQKLVTDASATATKDSVTDWISENIPDINKAMFDAVLSDKYISGLLDTLQGGGLITQEQFEQIEDFFNSLTASGEVDLKVGDIDFAQAPINEFSQGMSNVQNKFKIMETTIQLKYEGINKADENIIQSAENDIALLNYELDDLNAELDEISEQEQEVNEKYDKRFEALDKVKKVNSDIAAQQKEQLTIADALSRGDIAAAAKAVQEARAKEQERRTNAVQAALEKRKENELASIRSASGQTREELETKIRDLQKEIRDIEEDRLEPAQERIRLQTILMEEEIKGLTVLEKTQTEWNNIQNAVDIATTKTDAFKKSLEAARDVAAQIADGTLTPEGLTTAPTPTVDVGSAIDTEQIQSTPNTESSNPNQAEIDELNRLRLISRNKFKESSDPDYKQRLFDINVSRGLRIKELGGIPLASGGMVPGYMGGGKVSYFPMGGKVPYKALGGMFKSLGSDTVPAMLTPGEFVIKRSSVNEFGIDNLEKINNTGQLSDGSVYNYSVNVNVRSDANPDEIARSVMSQIKRVDDQRIRGNKF